jgi:flagellar biosynthesis protein FliQ
VTPELPGALLREALLLLAAVGGPVLGALLLVGLVVGVLQAATQVNDAAVGFLPRAAAAGAVIERLFAERLGLPVYLAIAVTAALMFGFGLLCERLLLRKMVGQPVIMVVMLTLGLEILLRGAAPGILDPAPKSVGLGIPFEPVIIADIFINRSYLVGGIGALALI